MIKTILFAGTGALALAACSGSAPDAAATQDPTAAIAASDAAPSPATGEAASVPPALAGAAPMGQAPVSQAPVSQAPVPPPPAAPPPPAEAVPPLAAPLPSRADKSEKGARAVLQTWARALETHQFGLAWEQFGSPPASRAAYARWWERYRTIHVSLGRGEGDAAMGSIYYTAPATLTGTTVAGKPFRLQGDVVVRRVNDVDGATPAQLRWHIGTADLKEVAGP